MGRGNSGKEYGTEFRTIYQAGNIKYIKYNDANNATVPQITRAKNRIYAVVNAQNNVKFVVFFDKEQKKSKQIDVSGKAHHVDGKRLDTPHTHLGYIHDENGTRELTPAERKILARVLRKWYHHISK